MTEIVLRHKITAKDSLNKFYSGKHWKKRQSEAQYWHLLVQSATKKIPKHIYNCPIIVHLAYNSALDIDNHGAVSKMIVDGLKGRFIVDDSRKYVVGIVQTFHNMEKDKIIVTLMEAKNEEV